MKLSPEDVPSPPLQLDYFMLQTLRFAGYAKTHLKMCVEKVKILANASRDSRLANVRDREIVLQ